MNPELRTTTNGISGFMDSFLEAVVRARDHVSICPEILAGMLQLTRPQQVRQGEIEIGRRIDGNDHGKREEELWLLFQQLRRILRQHLQQTLISPCLALNPYRLSTATFHTWVQLLEQPVKQGKSPIQE